MTGTFGEWLPDRPNTLVIACSDGRLQEATDELLTHHLQVTRYDRFYVPGGAGALAASGRDFLRAQQIRRECRYLVELHAVRHIVMLFHGPTRDGPLGAACADYRRKLPWASVAELRARQEQDAEELGRIREDWGVRRQWRSTGVRSIAAGSFDLRIWPVMRGAASAQRCSAAPPDVPAAVEPTLGVDPGVRCDSHTGGAMHCRRVTLSLGLAVIAGCLAHSRGKHATPTTSRASPLPPAARAFARHQAAVPPQDVGVVRRDSAGVEIVLNRSPLRGSRRLWRVDSSGARELVPVGTHLFRIVLRDCTPLVALGQSYAEPPLGVLRPPMLLMAVDRARSLRGDTLLAYAGEPVLVVQHSAGSSVTPMPFQPRSFIVPSRAGELVHGLGDRFEYVVIRRNGIVRQRVRSNPDLSSRHTRITTMSSTPL
jgi:hypothetical protein